MAEARPAFYALRPGGWRDYVTLLHLPYTLWHLSYVTIGAALAPLLDFARLGATLAAFFLAVGIGAHALDELAGRPLRTRVGRRRLITVAAVSLAGAVGIGIYSCFWISPWLAAFVVFGASAAVAYNLELAGGRFHTGLWFALFWGAFPVTTGYFAQSEELRAEALLAGACAAALSHAQRELSTQVRRIRRHAETVDGTIELRGGATEKIRAATLIATPEAALRALSVAMPLLAAALVAARA